jgi:putative protein-disulfide isomerase
MANTDCDVETGICQPESAAPARASAPKQIADQEVIYVGDPMCSWCWGIAPALRQLQLHCAHQRLPFRVLVGGLRPGGGDLWNREFKEFLAHHWREISKRTGQEFAFGILERETFDYDTEPACRSVVTARSLREDVALDFFAAVQRKFYVENEDPKVCEFYRGICNELSLDFDEFSRRFNSDDMKRRTQEEFQQSRNWGVSGFPSVLVQAHGRLTTITCGYSTFEKMRAALNSLGLANSS